MLFIIGYIFLEIPLYPSLFGLTTATSLTGVNPIKLALV